MTCGSQVVLSYVFISINEHVIFKLFLAFLGINFFKDFIVFLVKVDCFILRYWNIIVNCVTIIFYFWTTVNYIIKSFFILCTKFSLENFILFSITLENVFCFNVVVIVKNITDIIITKEFFCSNKVVVRENLWKNITKFKIYNVCICFSIYKECVIQLFCWFWFVVVINITILQSLCFVIN